MPIHKIIKSSISQIYYISLFDIVGLGVMKESEQLIYLPTVNSLQ